MYKLLLLPICGNADIQMQKEEADSQEQRKEGMYVFVGAPGCPSHVYSEQICSLSYRVCSQTLSICSLGV